MILGGVKGINEERVFRGISASCAVGVFAGRIRIVESNSASICESEAMLCFFERIEQGRLKYLVYPIAPAGVILSTRAISAEALSLLGSLGVPYLIIKEGFSRSLEGMVALLDTEKERLVIDPDLNSLSAWRAGAIVKREPKRFSLCFSESGVELGVCESPCSEELYEKLCELAERDCDKCVTLSLSSPQNIHERSEFFEYCVALLRAAVYGKFCLQIEGYSSENDVKVAFDLLRRAARRLEDEGRESNPDVKLGVLIDTPAWLMRRSAPSGSEFVCVDVEAICARLLGREITGLALPESLSEPLRAFFEQHLAIFAPECQLRIRGEELLGAGGIWQGIKSRLQ